MIFRTNQGILQNNDKSLYSLIKGSDFFISSIIPNFWSHVFIWMQ